MLKSDSPKEEGEISDEDDMVVGVSALVPNMGDSVIILPGPQHARDIPCHAPKVANKTSKQRQKRKSKQRKPVVTYNKETYHTIKGENLTLHGHRNVVSVLLLKHYVVWLGKQ